MRGPEKKPIVHLVGEGIMGKVKRALRVAGADTEYVNKYLQESMSSDNSNGLLKIALKYVTVG